MIKLFRKIRYDLMETGKTGKYLKYAIGEIVLVVIGILIALQINNWNNQEQEHKFEKKVLHEILTDTEEDLKEMSDALNALKESQRSGELIIEAFHNNILYNDSMDVHFAKALRFWSLTPNSTAFEAAKSEGLYLIKNDSIRKMVAKINGHIFDYVRVLESRWQDYNTTIVLPHFSPLFNNFVSMKPTDYDSLKKDTLYIGMLQTLIGMRTRYIYVLENRYRILVELNNLLNNELK